MQETKEEKKEEKALVLVGHFHHTAKCSCGTSVTVESYYEQVPTAHCPSCKTLNPVITEFQQEPFVSVKTTTRCKECACRFSYEPTTNAQFVCPMCAKPQVETDGITPPTESKEGQTETKN